MLHVGNLLFSSSNSILNVWDSEKDGSLRQKHSFACQQQVMSMDVLSGSTRLVAATMNLKHQESHLELFSISEDEFMKRKFVIITPVLISQVGILNVKIDSDR